MQRRINIMKSFPTFDYEKTYWDKGLSLVAGIDEVGRGAFAGPVVVGAVILPQTNFPRMTEINDSKLLMARQREELAKIIKTYAIGYAIAEISVEIINIIGIGKATFQAMQQAVEKLKPQPQHILIDAFYIPEIAKEKQLPIIKGDQKSYTIAAASIIAKVYRDNLMTKLGEKHQSYLFGKNKGYGTLQHRNAIQKYGLCKAHRTSFNLTPFLSS